ncbi:hypothetical protein [Absidia glauca]|uniref:EF-hand domain-containing protein n=1 Tax=Absidia glauca TaxID=4829 RepID=A0A168QHW7_ABSGL|nr:hypothetical protein [Absidia glauca]
MDNTHHIEISDEVTFFKLHDLDRDGYWNDHEVQAIYGLERDIPDAPHVTTIVRRAFEELDSNMDGLISMKEYMVKHLPNWTEEEIQAEKQWRLTHTQMDDGQQLQHPMHASNDHEPAATWEDQDDDDDDDDNEDHKGGILPDKYRAL